jgi:hypothetical protein
MPGLRKLSQQEIDQLETTPPPITPSDKTDGDAGIVDATYPHLAAWVYERGWIEIGQDHYSRSFIRILDEGGMVWEGATRYASLDAALRAADMALGELLSAGEL